MTRSSITPPGAGRAGRFRAQALIDAVFIRVHSRNEPTGLQAIGKAREPLPRYVRRTRPEPRIAVAGHRACQKVERHDRVKWSDGICQLLGAVFSDPDLRTACRAYDGIKRGAVAANAVARGEECRIDRRSARTGSVEDIARARSQR